MSYVVVAKGAVGIRKFAAATKLDAIEEAADLQKRGLTVIITDESGRLTDSLNQYVTVDMVSMRHPQWSLRSATAKDQQP